MPCLHSVPSFWLVAPLRASMVSFAETDRDFRRKSPTRKKHRARGELSRVGDFLRKSPSLEERPFVSMVSFAETDRDFRRKSPTRKKHAHPKETPTSSECRPHPLGRVFLLLSLIYSDMGIYWSHATLADHHRRLQRRCGTATARDSRPARAGGAIGQRPCFIAADETTASVQAPRGLERGRLSECSCCGTAAALLAQCREAEADSRLGEDVRTVLE